MNTRTNKPVGVHGLTPAEERLVRDIEGRRAEQSRRERLTIAAQWAMTHGAACGADSKGWPVDASDWPLRPHAGMLAETVRDYRKAVTMAKARRTRKANTARRAEADAFDITKIDLKGVPVFGSTEARAESEGRRHAEAKRIAMYR